MRPLILVSNDDGILAPGIKVLAETVAEFGDVVVCAPDSQRSASSHAITLHANLRTTQIKDGWLAVSGTPVDSVYLGALHICPRLPDLVVAGINDGYNLGADVFYSGTVGAAREGRLRGCSALAVSIEGGTDPRVTVPGIRELVPMLLRRHAAGERHLLNVNYPRPKETGTTIPLAVASLGERVYEDMVDERADLMGRPYFWIGGPPAPTQGTDGDVYAVTHGMAAVTPLAIDITADSVEAWTDEIGDPRGSS
jgi:5'-nucleotidase